MDFLSSPFNVVIKDILSVSDVSTKNVSIEANLIVNKSTKMFLENIVDLEEMADFNTNFSDSIFINFLLGKGDYAKVVFNNRDNLELELKKKIGKIELLEVYKCIVLNNFEDIENGKDSRLTRTELNKEGLVNVECQLISLTTEVFRRVTVSGSFLNTTVKKVIQSQIKKYMSDVTIDDKALDLKIEMVEPDNDNAFKQIIIPSGISLINLASYLHNKDYGVYNGNIGTYISKTRKDFKEDKADEEYNDTIHIYPLYNVNNNNRKKLNIYTIPSVKVDLLDRTFKDSNNKLELLVSDNIKIKNLAPLSEIEQGTGFKALVTKDLMFSSFDQDENNIGVKSDRNLSDMAYKKRRDNLDVPTTTKSTNNLFVERSKLMKNNGQLLQVQWNFSVPELIDPGMPVNFFFLDENEEINELKGIVQNVYTRTVPDRQMSSSLITIFIEQRPIKEE